MSGSHLHILYYNARSLLSKLDKLRATVTLEQPHIVCIVETWLSPVIADNELQICGYQLVRLDRNRHGGVILMYVNDVFSFRVLLESGPEFLAVLLYNHLSPNICVSLLSSPSSTVSVFENLFYTLQALNPFFFYISDFNVNFCNSSHYLFPHLNHIVHCFSLTQVVPSYAYVHPNGAKSLIDLALLLDLSKLSHCEIISPLGSSDHYGIAVVLNMQQYHYRSKPSRLVWVYDQADFDKARNQIREIDWENPLLGSIDECALLWQQSFLTIMAECIPRKVLSKDRKLPWINYLVIKLIRKQNAAFRKANKSAKASDEAKFP